MVENPPSNAGDIGSTPNQGTKISHATAREARAWPTAEPALSRAGEKPVC